MHMLHVLQEMQLSVKVQLLKCFTATIPSVQRTTQWYVEHGAQLDIGAQLLKPGETRES